MDFYKFLSYAPVGLSERHFLLRTINFTTVKIARFLQAFLLGPTVPLSKCII